MSHWRLVVLASLFALSAGGAYLIGGRIWPHRPHAGAHAPPPAACEPTKPGAVGQRPASDLEHLSRAISAAAATPKPAGMALPPLDDLARAAVSDPRALHVRTALMMQVGAQVFVDPSCVPPSHQGKSVVALTVTVAVQDETKAVFQDARDLEVVEGAPLSDATRSCVKARLNGPSTLVGRPGKPFATGFRGEVRVSVLLNSPRSRDSDLGQAVPD